jgi:phenylpropionate dioxygenase-like ring-hydroxylating dioxygenase large terminal subunit
MIPRQWFVVMDSGQVRNRPVGVIRLGEKLVFWRDSTGRVACLRDRCVHRGVQLSRGRVLRDHLHCPFHGLEYDASGRVTRIPASGRNTPVPDRFGVHGYPTYEAQGFIWVWWGKNPPEDLKPPRFFDDIGEGFSYGRVYDHWNAHYSRAIENQLDVAHLPFVHHNTIGRGGFTLVDGPGIQWASEDQLFVYYYNRLDDGTPPRRPDEVPVPDPEKDFKLEFIFPNLWQNHISEDVRIVLAFVPIDDENTLMYLRFYQKLMRLPILRRLVNRLAMPFNLVIAHQDRRVVVTHQPRISALRSDEQLIQADLPIIEYRRRRQELMEKNSGLTHPPVDGD